MRKRTATYLATALILVFLVLPARAQTGPGGDVVFTLAPYGWLTGLSGTIGVRGLQANVDASFADLSKYLNIAGMIHADFLYRDTFGILGEVNYAQLGDQASAKRVTLDGQMGLFLSDVAAYYRLCSGVLGKEGAPPSSLDLLAGIRIWSLAMHLKSETALNNRSAFKQTAWVDPVVGLRAKLRLTEKWGFELRGGVGGFGLSSAITWDAMALLAYTFWEHGTAFLGYRAVGVNHDQGGGQNYFKFNAVLSGPIIGAAFKF